MKKQPSGLHVHIAQATISRYRRRGFPWGIFGLFAFALVYAFVTIIVIFHK